MTGVKSLSLALVLSGLGLVFASWAASGRVNAAPRNTAPVTRTPEDLRRRATALATYAGGEVTVGEVEDAIGIVAPHGLASASDWSTVHSKFAQLLQTELLEIEARRRGYANNDRVQIRIQELASDLMIAQVNQPLESYIPSTEELSEFFQSHQAELGAPELRRVIELVVSTEAEARALLPSFQAAANQALRDLIKTKSIDVASRTDDGYSRYFDRNGLLDDKSASVDPALAEAAYALAGIGATSDVVKLKASDGKQRYAILRLAALRPAYVPTLQQATPTARKLIIDERREQGRAQLEQDARKHFTAVVHPELLDKLPAELPPADSTRN
jgi:hypothetical protein